jgi:conjugal transfer pilus assembly protein TrbC
MNYRTWQFRAIIGFLTALCAHTIAQAQAAQTDQIANQTINTKTPAPVRTKNGAALPTSNSAEKKAVAQPMPSDAALNAILREQAARSAEAVAKTQGIPSVQSMPRLSDQGAPKIDLEGLMNQFGQVKQAIQNETKEEGLVLFVSLTMPEATLHRMIDQSVRYKVPLVIQGLTDGSMKKTVSKITQLLAKREGDFQVDPRLFDRFNINRVPALVLINPEGKWATAYGDVSIEFALQAIERQQPALAPFARSWLAKGANP